VRPDSSLLHVVESCAGRVNPHALRVPAFAGRVREPVDICVRLRAKFSAGRVRNGLRKLFVRVTEWLRSACKSDMSKNFIPTEILRCNGVATFSSVGETTDWSTQPPVILQEIRSAWWQLALLANECLLWLCTAWKTEEQIWRARQWTKYSLSIVIWKLYVRSIKGSKNSDFSNFSKFILKEITKKLSLELFLNPRWRHPKKPWPAPVVSSPRTIQT